MIEFFVLGTPRTKGSFVSFVNPKNGRLVTKNQLPTTSQWQKQIANEARLFRPPSLWSEAVSLDCTFFLKKGKTVTREHPCVFPDIDKLLRCVFDGLSGVIYADDKQVVDVCARKVYGKVPGVVIKVWQAE
ncbi:MAG: RusA family crossover junction endodeoxyribonuclease [Nitrospirales bacterium]